MYYHHYLGSPLIFIILLILIIGLLPHWGYMENRPYGYYPSGGLGLILLILLILLIF